VIVSFEARYRSTCPDCQGPIVPGEMIRSVGPGQFVHDLCPDDPDPVVSTRGSSRRPTPFQGTSTDPMGY
jgi:hypothetical protein